MITLLFWCVVILILIAVLSQKVDISITRDKNYFFGNLELMLIGIEFQGNSEMSNNKKNKYKKPSFASFFKILRYVLKKSSVRLEDINIFSPSFRLELSMRLYALINSFLIFQYYKYKRILKRSFRKWLKAN